MKEEEARETLRQRGIMVTGDGVIACDSPYVRFRDDGEITLDGDFTGQELEAITFFVRKRKNTPSPALPRKGGGGCCDGGDLPRGSLIIVPMGYWYEVWSKHIPTICVCNDLDELHDFMTGYEMARRVFQVEPGEKTS